MTAPGARTARRARASRSSAPNPNPSPSPSLSLSLSLSLTLALTLTLSLTLTRSLKRRYWPYSGLLDGSAAVNPTFAGFHRVNLAYCDGSAFTGDRAEPVVTASGEKLYFRGKRVLALLLDELLAAGLRHARRLLLVSQHGQSAPLAAPQLASCASSGRAWRR